MRDLLGTPSPPLRRFAIVWALLGGWVLSSTVFLLFARNASALLLVAVIPAVLGALAVAKATRDREAPGGAVVGLSVLASLATPFVMAGIGVLFAVAAGGADHLDVMLGVICVGGSVCAFLAAPLGVLFGMIFASVWIRLLATREAGRSSHEEAWVVFGLASLLLGAFEGLLAAAVPASTARLASPDLLIPLAAGCVVFGLLTVGRGLSMKRRRRRLAERVRRGHLAGCHAVCAAELAEVPDDLPQLFARRSEEILVRRCLSARGPFRSNEVVEPLAWL